MPNNAPVTTPKQWWLVYRNDKECKLFKALSRGTHEWRTTEGLVKATKLKQSEVESILSRYIPSGIIQQHSKEPNKFRYWERATKKKKKIGSISSEDKKRRVSEKMNASSP